jgi:hypothetical protein
VPGHTSLVRLGPKDQCNRAFTSVVRGLVPVPSPLLGMWILGLHRVKFPVSDRAVSQDFGDGVIQG